MTLSLLAKLRASLSRRVQPARRRPRTALELEYLEARITPQASRTWVSGVGDDANPCSRTAPGKTFAGAISKTAAGGEIDALDSGGFGALTITKAITIDGSGNLAGVLVSGTNGIVINAGVNDTVILRGLNFDGDNLTGLSGILVNSAKVVDIEDCTFENFKNFGIDFTPTNAGAQLIVNNSVVRDCVLGGIQIAPANGVAATAQIDNTQAELNKFGFGAFDNTVVNISNSVAAGNTNNGFAALSVSLSAHMNLQNDVASNNGTNGIRSTGANARVSISNVTVTGNSGLATMAASGGVIASSGNNTITDNSKAFTAAAIVAGSGSGGATRTWVSGVGDDANPCSRTAPGKTFAGAISKTAAGGEIDVLDPGGFGEVTIARAVTIDGSGAFGSILVSGTPAITINALPTDVVILRGLSFQGIGLGTVAIKINTAAAVFIENCSFQNFTGAGIDFEPTNANAQLFVENTTVTNCGGGGVLIKPTATGTNARALLDHVFSQFNNLFGFAVEDLADATITNSAANGNANNGFTALAVNNSAFMNLSGDASTNNKTNGVRVQGNGAISATANMSGVTVTGNVAKGLLSMPGGFINSFGNLDVQDNPGGDGTPTGTMPLS